MRRLGWLASLILIAGGCAPAAPSASGASTSPSPAAVVSPSAAAAASPSPPSSSHMAPTPSAPPHVGDGEPWLVFQTMTAAGYGVHFIRPDGSGLHRWAAGVPGTHEHPDWSPDGSQLVLNTVMPDETEDLWIGQADGSEAHLVLDCVDPCTWIDEPAWSPDGTQVAFQRVVEQDHGHFVSTLELFDVASGTASVVLQMPDQQVVLQPRWAPDGRRIVVEYLHLAEDSIDADIDDGAIGVVDLDDDDPRVRRIAGDFANSPDWSADGSNVLWSRPGASGGSDVWVAAPDGSDAKAVTDLAATGGGADQPAFTPDGQGVVFVWSEPATPGRIGQVGIDGSGLTSAIGDRNIDAMHPRWRPLAASGG